jgi:hypothetical protein
VQGIKTPPVPQNAFAKIRDRVAANATWGL